MGLGLGFTWAAAAEPRGRPVLTLTGVTPCLHMQPTEPVSLPSRQPPLPPRPPHLLTTQLTSHLNVHGARSKVNANVLYPLMDATRCHYHVRTCLGHLGPRPALRPRSGHYRGDNYS